MRRAEHEGLVPKRVSEAQQIDRLLKAGGLSEYERMELVRRRAEILEMRARREEQLLRVGGRDDEGRVDEHYIDAIQAKLRILDQI